MKTPLYSIGYGGMLLGALVLATLCFARGQNDLGGITIGCGALWVWARREEWKGRRRTRRPGGWQPANPQATLDAESRKLQRNPIGIDADGEVVYDVKIDRHPPEER